MISPRQCVQRKQYNSQADLTQLFSQAIESEESNLPCGRIYIPLESQPLAQSYIGYIDVTCVLLHCASQKLSVSAWQKLLGTHTLSHHIAWCPCTDYTKFSCLRKSLDGASPFVSAIAIQLTPSYTRLPAILHLAAAGQVTRWSPPSLGRPADIRPETTKSAARTPCGQISSFENPTGRATGRNDSRYGSSQLRRKDDDDNARWFTRFTRILG